MGAEFLLLIPVVSLAVDYTSWMEACWIKRILKRGPSSDLSYFQTDGILIRNALLSGTLLFAWLGSQASGADQIAAASVAITLFVAHVGFAIWSFRNNLEDMGRMTNIDSKRR